ncbi:MAG: Maf family protein [Myxococcota bacterium]|nr:Maf family protein [Myxococcota bacterium]
MNRRLVLASTSGARRALMDALGVPYEALAPGVDEVVPEGTSALGAVAILSERKARAVSEREPDALVIGADQLVTIDGAVLGKPETREAARAQLSLLLGRTHEIVTAVSVMGAGFEEHVVDVARLTVYPLSAGELEQYLDLEEWRGCAGGYRVEGAGQALFQRIEGDRTSIQGLPMLEVVRLLRRAGVPFFRPAGI